jgi:Ca2+-binding EF-hand superfamily protein
MESRLLTGDGGAPKELHKWAARLWMRMDRDGNGTISRQELDCEEFRGILRALMAPEAGCMGGPSYARAEMNMNQALAFLLRKADLNSDQRISFEEFEALALRLRQDRLERRSTAIADLVFALFDLNQDGKLDKQEFREVYRFYHGRTPTESEFQREWAKLDKHAKFRIPREEYVRWLETSAANTAFWQGTPATTPAAGHAHSGNVERSLAAVAKQIGPRSKSEGALQAGVSERSSLPPAASSSSFAGARPVKKDHPWRPWDSYGHLGWARVQQTDEKLIPHPRSGTVGSGSRAGTASTGHRHGGSGASVGDSGGHSSSAADWKQEATWTSKGSQRSLDLLERPAWNRRVDPNPNWVNSQGRVCRPKGLRIMFSNPHTLSELQRYYQTHNGFQEQGRKLREEVDPPHKRTILSTEPLLTSPEDFIPGRGAPPNAVGRMRHPKTGERTTWRDQFQEPPQLKDLYVTSCDYRLSPPPRHLYVDEYDDEV